jgi:hypothetical protein
MKKACDHIIVAKLDDTESFKECVHHFPDELNTAVLILANVRKLIK